MQCILYIRIEKRSGTRVRMGGRLRPREIFENNESESKRDKENEKKVMAVGCLYGDGSGSRWYIKDSLESLLLLLLLLL